MTKDKDTLVIIDADGLIYSASYKVASGDEALLKCKEYLYNIYINTNAKYSIGFLTSSSHRYEIAKTQSYKGNRKDFEKPKYFNLLLEYLKHNFNFGYLPQTEADDLCISAYMKYKDEFNCVISSPDKDLRQIEGLFYSPKTFKHEYVTQEQAEYNFYIQMLMGDTTDNILGIPGIGIKTAEKLLTGIKSEDLFEVVLNKYLEYYKNPSLAYYKFSETYLLLYLRRNIEFDTPINEVDFNALAEYKESLITKLEKGGKVGDNQDESKQTSILF